MLDGPVRQERCVRYISCDYRTLNVVSQVFRTQPSIGPDSDATRFFSTAGPPTASFSPGVYDVSALYSALPPQTQSAIHSPALHQSEVSARWASDFMQQQPMHAPGFNPLNQGESMDVQLQKPVASGMVGIEG